MMIAEEKPAVAVKVAVSVVIALVAVAFVVNTRIVDDANEPEGVRKNKNLQQGKPKCFRETAARSFQHVYRNLSEDAKGGRSHNAILADSRESLAVPVSDAMPHPGRLKQSVSGCGRQNRFDCAIAWMQALRLDVGWCILHVIIL
jgi:hypothetical protein